MFIYDSRIDWMASDGKKYKIFKTDNEEINKKKAEYLMELNKTLHKIVDYMYLNHLPTKQISNKTKNRCKNLMIVEILEKEGAAYTTGKGLNLCLCLITNGKFNEMNDCKFVLSHEIAHIMSDSYGHGDEFKQNFNFIVKLAVGPPVNILTVA